MAHIDAVYAAFDACQAENGADQSCFYDNVPPELQHSLVSPEVFGNCADFDEHIESHKAFLDNFIAEIERNIAFINWATAQMLQDEIDYCQAQSDVIAERRSEAQMAVVMAFMDPPQADYEYLFGTEMIPDGNGGFIVDKYSGALNGMLDGVELQGADWQGWRTSLINEFENGMREG